MIWHAEKHVTNAGGNFDAWNHSVGEPQHAQVKCEAHGTGTEKIKTPNGALKDWGFFFCIFTV